MEKEIITSKQLESLKNALLNDQKVIGKIVEIMLAPDYKLTTIVVETGDGGTILIHVNNKPELCISIVDKYGRITKLNSYDAYFGYTNGFVPSCVCKYLDKLDKYLFNMMWPQDVEDIINNIQEGYTISKEQPIKTRPRNQVSGGTFQNIFS